MRENNINLIIATNSFVKKVQNIAKSLKDKIKFLINGKDIFHAEIIGIKSYAFNKELTMNALKKLEDIFFKNNFTINYENNRDFIIKI